jgi:hypothetical protein
MIRSAVSPLTHMRLPTVVGMDSIDFGKESCGPVDFPFREVLADHLFSLRPKRSGELGLEGVGATVDLNVLA